MTIVNQAASTTRVVSSEPIGARMPLGSSGGPLACAALQWRLGACPSLPGRAAGGPGRSCAETAAFIGQIWRMPFAAGPHLRSMAENLFGFEKPMKYQSSIKTVLSGLLAVSVLAACGGGGGSDPPELQPAPEVAAPPAEFLETCPLPAVAQIRIETDEHRPVVDKDNYIAASFQVSGPAQAQEPEGSALSMKIRGRGNTTWDMPKRPYLLKFDDKVSVLGMSANKKWVLLANYSDKSMLRSALAFCTARLMGMAYTPQDRFVELTLNGDYLGLYQITNKDYEVRDLIEKQGKTYFNEVTNTSSFDDPFLIEINWRTDEDFNFVTTSGIGFSFDSDSNAAQVRRVRGWLGDLETDLGNLESPETWARVSTEVDLASLANLYLVNELASNTDAFYSSTYLYRFRGGPLAFGPVWDFDLAYGNVDYESSRYPEGWYVRDMRWAWYLRALLRQPAFAEMVRQRWAVLGAQVPQLLGYVRAAAGALDEAQRRNFVRWPILEQYVWPNSVVTGSYAGEVDFLRDWLYRRAQWIDDNIPWIEQTSDDPYGGGPSDSGPADD
ncbi:MAG TPA: CotH kinase family protein [Ottowia sp.]|nr:CotH kinase family protein [Ottowia sp.]